MTQNYSTEMKDLIGAPLSAAADAGLHLAKSTSRFIEQAALDNQGKVRTVTLKYNQKIPESDGELSDCEMAVEVPVLLLTQIPNLGTDSVHISFDMEVKGIERGNPDWGSTATVWGSVAPSVRNSRRTDHSAKYHVSVSASNCGATEGLSRVLDILASSLTPKQVSERGMF